MRKTLGIVAVVMIVLGGCGWTRPRFDAANTGSNPFETTISPANVGSLTEQFRLPAAAEAGQIPGVVVARGHAFVGGNPIRAFDAGGLTGCSGSPRVCAPQWSLSGDGNGNPDVIGTNLYVYNDVFDADGALGCGGQPRVCDLLGYEDGPIGSFSTDPANLHLLAYGLFGIHTSTFQGQIAGYNADCHPQLAPCATPFVADLGTVPGDGTVGGPAIGGGRVFGSISSVQTNTGTLIVFDGTHSPATVLWSGALPGVGSADAAVAEGVVVTTVRTAVGSQLLAFDATGHTNCSGSPVVCQPLWRSDVWTGAGTDAAPAIAGGTVYRAVGSQVRAYDLHGGTNCTGAPKVCQKLWVGSMGAGITAPAVAGGVVYVGDSTGHVDAFDAKGVTGCSATTRVCGALWDHSLGTAAGPPAVAGGRVYVAGLDGVVRVFGPS